jgi:hypothetical protein
MNTRLETIFSDAEGRYLQGAEERALLDYAESVPSRLAATKAVEAAEDTIIDETLAEIWSRHPDFEHKHPAAKDRARRDITLVLRYAALAMLRNDETLLTERLLYWLATILAAQNMTTVVDTAYRTLALRTEANIAPEHTARMAPYLKLAHGILTQSVRR